MSPDPLALTRTNPVTITEYEVWEEGATRKTDGPFLTPAIAGRFAAGHNTEEAENARMELRPVARTFVVVQATTVRTIVSAAAPPTPANA